MDVCNTGLVLAQCRILRCLQGKKNVIQKNFAARFAGIHHHLSTLTKRNISTAKNCAEKKQKKALVQAHIRSQKRGFWGSILQFTHHLLINKGDQNILPGVYLMLCSDCTGVQRRKIAGNGKSANAAFAVICCVEYRLSDRSENRS